MQYLRKLSVYIILTGMLLVLASCVPVLGTLYRLLNPDHGSEIRLSLNDVTRTTIEVEGQEQGRLTLLVEPAKKDVRLNGVRYRHEIISGNNALDFLQHSLANNFF